MLDRLGITQWKKNSRYDFPISSGFHPSEVIAADKRLTENPEAYLQQDNQANRDPKISETPSAAFAETEQTISDWTDLSKRFLESNHCDTCNQDSALSLGPHAASLAIIVDSPLISSSDYSRYFSQRKLKLLMAILNCLSLELDDVYFSSVFKCIPSAPESGDIASCDHFLSHELRLSNANTILSFGEFTAQKLLSANGSLEQLRKQYTGRELSGARLIMAPDLTDLLNQPELKAALWADIKAIYFAH